LTRTLHRTSSTLVRTPSGATIDVTDPALAAELAPGARVIRQNRGVFDTFPLSMITTQTITGLSAMAATPLDAQRFRPNFLVEAIGAAPFAEDAWVGCVLRVGSLRMRVDKRDGRCVVITIDPATTERSPAILRAVVSERQGCLGVYGTTVEPERVAMHDPVFIEAAT
jgi:MOSC domain-containing protein